MPSKSNKNQRLVLAERPARGPVTSKTFRRETIDIPQLKDGEVLVKVEYSAIEATMRNWLNDARSYIEPVKIGEVMRALGIGRVVDSKSERFRAGDLVYGTLGWQTYFVGPAKDLRIKQTPRGGRDIDHLGLFGISGMTAYFGIFDIGRLKDGETVVISGAAGSVGLIATQIALAHPKCKVVAIAGSADKCQKLKELGCHTVLNYKDKDWQKGLKSVGLVDVYFDNVGGEILDVLLTRMKPYGRIVACGAISAYRSSANPHALKNYPTIISMKLPYQGFIAMDYTSRYAEAAVYLADLAGRGKMNYEYTILAAGKGGDGLDRCVEGMEVVSSGRNLGKTIIKIGSEDDGLAKAKL